MTREEAIKYIKSRCIGSTEERDGTQWSEAMWMAIEALADRPTGEWMLEEYKSRNHIENFYICSSCRNFEAWGKTELYNYCPNCGAKMKGGDTE